MITVNLEAVELQETMTAGGPIRAAFPLHAAVGTASTGAVLFELEPGDALAPHTDSAEEILVVLQGEAEAIVGGRRTALAASEIVVIPAMVSHGVRNVGDTPLRVLGVFSASTVVSTFEEPLVDGGPQVMVIGAPVPMAATLQQQGVPA
jgi:quercetin dioxygenase-like cupin family protein